MIQEFETYLVAKSMGWRFPPLHLKYIKMYTKYISKISAQRRPKDV
jgi:hypothetical protein